MSAICGGGPFTEVVTTRCPWCWLPGDPERVSLRRDVFDGYGGPDWICGHCGQFWSADAPLRRMGEDERERNIELVRTRVGERNG